MNGALIDVVDRQGFRHLVVNDKGRISHAIFKHNASVRQNMIGPKPCKCLSIVAAQHAGAADSRPARRSGKSKNQKGRGG